MTCQIEQNIAAFDVSMNLVVFVQILQPQHCLFENSGNDSLLTNTWTIPRRKMLDNRKARPSPKKLHYDVQLITRYERDELVNDVLMI